MFRNVHCVSTPFFKTADQCSRIKKTCGLTICMAGSIVDWCIHCKKCDKILQILNLSFFSSSWTIQGLHFQVTMLTFVPVYCFYSLLHHRTLYWLLLSDAHFLDNAKTRPNKQTKNAWSVWYGLSDTANDGVLLY